MTGMPAWGVTHGDDAIWPVVAFMTRLHELDADGYQQMLVDAAGHGHHAEEAPHEDGGEEAATSEIHLHDDGTEHDHAASTEPTQPDASAEHDDSTHEHDD